MIEIAMELKAVAKDQRTQKIKNLLGNRHYVIEATCGKEIDCVDGQKTVMLAKGLVQNNDALALRFLDVLRGSFPDAILFYKQVEKMGKVYWVGVLQVIKLSGKTRGQHIALFEGWSDGGRKVGVNFVTFVEKKKSHLDRLNDLFKQADELVDRRLSKGYSSVFELEEGEAIACSRMSALPSIEGLGAPKKRKVPVFEDLLSETLTTPSSIPSWTSSPPTSSTVVEEEEEDFEEDFDIEEETEAQRLKREKEEREEREREERKRKKKKKEEEAENALRKQVMERRKKSDW